MKKLLFISLFLLLAASAFSQDKAEYIYSEIVGTQKLLSNKVTIEIDYGQATKFAEINKLRDADGKPIVFNSMVDAMNWMGAKGWEFCQAYVVTAQNTNVYHYLLKYDTKNLTEEEVAALKAEFNTKK